MSVEWRPIPGYPGYSVSNTGLIRSDKSGGKIKKQRTTKTGKKDVGLWHNGKNHHELVHRLVAKAFIPNPEDLPYVLHYDDVPDNNHVDNLRWGTQYDNMQDSIRNGTHPTHGKTHCKNGHEFTPGNTRAGSKGERRCVMCFREYHRNYQRERYNTLKNYERDIRR